MTTGEKIAQKRKELSLSQEALGEKLGLSRQAIYKWESDAALPEIDKLVALSKLFGVSVGWLLGAEEPATGEGPEGDPGRELSEKELQMVEEIASRYLAAQPQQTPKQKGGGFFAAFLVALIAAVVLLPLTLILFWRMSDLEERYYGLQSSTNRIYANIEQEMGAVTDRVEEILKTQNSLLADYRCELTGADLKENTVTFSLRATPKTWAEGLSALFVVNTGEKYEEFPAPAEEDRSFSGELTVPLTDSITLSVVLTTPDGARSTQLLEAYTDLRAQSMPQLDEISDKLWEFGQNGREMSAFDSGQYPDFVYWRQSGMVSGLDIPGIDPARVTDVKMGLFKNGDLLTWAQPVEDPGYSVYRGYEGFSFAALPNMELTLEPAKDLLQAVWFFRDSYGRIFVERESYQLGANGRLIHLIGTSTHSAPEEWNCPKDADGWPAERSVLTGADLAAGTVTFSLRATPPAPCSTAVFRWTSGADSGESPAQMGEEGSFTGAVTVPLTDSITFSAVFTAPDGAQTTQDLGTCTGLYARSRPITDLSLSPQVIDADSGAIRGTTITLPGSPGSNLGWDTWDPKEAAPGEALVDGMAPAAVVEGKYGLFKDGELLCWYVPGRQPDWNIKAVGKNDDFLWWEAPEMTFTLEPGEVLQRVRFCRDSYGRVLSQLAGAWVQDTNPGRLLPAPDPENGWELDAWSYPRDADGWPLAE